MAANAESTGSKITLVPHGGSSLETLIDSLEGTDGGQNDGSMGKDVIANPVA